MGSYDKLGPYGRGRYDPRMEPEVTLSQWRKGSQWTLTWTDRSRGGAHPATFGKADITEGFFKKIFEGQVCLYNSQRSTVCYLFARKFAPSALDPSLELASKVFGY
ncbi:hypothetical protein REPUB_Repub13aG0183200 [Reevesia pubescens]